jgi:lipid II:glycine glycyltransferase (peptidoglycan interpeptide bridge formation enzyme)
MAISNVKTRLKNLEDILKQLNEEIRQKNETAAKIDNDNVKKNAVIERKQNMVDQYNKRIEVMKNKDGVRIFITCSSQCSLHVCPVYHTFYTCSSHVESHIL